MHTRYRVLIFLLVLATSSGVFARSDAAAAQPRGWLEWLMPTGTICVRTGGSAIAARAAASWDRSDAVIVAHSTCTGYARNMTVVFIGYNKPSEIACGKAGSSAGWMRKNVRGASVLTPRAPTIWINYATKLRTGCRANNTMLAHLFNHELGHILGLDHNSGVPSVMAAVRTRYYWKYHTPTTYDLQLVNRRY